MGLLTSIATGKMVEWLAHLKMRIGGLSFAPKATHGQSSREISRHFRLHKPTKMAQQRHHQPLLLAPLRAALASLYSLPGRQHSHDDPAIHRFLVDVQCRNVRRKRQSRMQSVQDGGDATAAAEADVAEDSPGSIWLACLCLLTLPDAHDAERLFAAQTMLGRLRRARLSEAIDVEVEDLSIASNGVTNEVMTKYAAWVSAFHPLLASAADRCRQQQQQQAQPLVAGQCLPLDVEERFKGQMTVFVLAAALCLASASSVKDGVMHGAAAGPLLSTLGSALSITSLRLRYPPPVAGSRPKTGSFPHTANNGASNAAALADPNTPPLVTMVAQSVIASADETEAMLGGAESGGRHASHRAICAAIASLPDSILGVPGGARSRISVDPRSIRAAAFELRGSFAEMAAALESRAPSVIEGAEASVHAPIFEVCLSWALYVPLPLDFIEHTVPLASRYIGSCTVPGSGVARRLAFSYGIAIFEGATKTVEEILQTILGIGGGTPQLNRKRQSSKSKKRQKERLDDAIQSDQGSGEDSILADAEQELLLRQVGSCCCARLALESIKVSVTTELTSPDGGEASGGEGPIGCLASCASACLPFIIKSNEAQLSQLGDVQSLFQATSELLLLVASSNSSVVRALTYSPILAVHGGLVKAGPTSCNDQVYRFAIDFVFRSTMVLANECKYPPHYFDHMDEDNDEDLEIERNDVRDVVRTVSGSDDPEPKPASMMILDKILNACAEACSPGNGDPSSGLPPETAVHTLSSLAKPINRIASSLTSSQTSEHTQASRHIVMVALGALGNISESIIKAFAVSVPMSVIFPVSRLQSLAAASFAPTIRSIALVLDSVDDDMKQAFVRSLHLLIHACLVGLARIPELAARSSLDSTQYDIRGAMRGPGGEDHVSCIAIFRLAHESDTLARLMKTTYATGEESSSKLVLDCCALHEQLKQDELARGPGIHHGRGTTPKTRRILLQAVCKLGLVSIEEGNSNGDDNAGVISSKVKELFHAPLHVIVQTHTNPPGDRAEVLYRVCEAVFDLSAFPTQIIASLFSVDEHQNVPELRMAVEYIVELVVSGYQLVSTPGDSPDNICMQWGRLRAAFFSLLRVCRSPGLPPLALEAVAAINIAECNAISTQLNFGASSPSLIFHDDVVGDEALPAGAFLQIINETLEAIMKEKDQSILSPQDAIRCTDDCVSSLKKSEDVLKVLMHPSPESSGHVDPRPPVGEAWFYSLTSAIKSYAKHIAPPAILGNTTLSDMLGQSFVTILQMLYTRSPEKEAGDKMCMSVDGPQTLATLALFEAALSLGPEMVNVIYKYVGPHVVMDPAIRSALEASPQPTLYAGGALLGAALFRAASGCWPPWAVEGAPEVYSALFVSVCGCDTELFCHIQEAAAEIKLADNSNAQCGSVLPGTKLAGKHFDRMGERTKEEFMGQLRKICAQNDGAGWRRMKVVLKALCGGKKKQSGFNQKPSLTDWDCDRINRL